MTHFKYFIIGGGMTADAAISGIRQVDKEGSICMISREIDMPYDRPPLSKGLWKDKPFGSIWRKNDYNSVNIILGHSIISVDPQLKQVTTDNKIVHSYEKLLFATGGTPRRLPFAIDDIIYFRTLQDYLTLREMAGKKQKFAVIGGGFIGSEIAAALRMNGKDVVMIFPEAALCERVFPKEISNFLNDYYIQKGVEILNVTSVKDIIKQDNIFILQSGNNQNIVADGIIAGLGIQLETDLAYTTGLKVDNGIIVDDFLQTNINDIYAAGDVANFYNPALQKRIRVKHEDNANNMGRIAGLNMAGKAEPYDYLPYFYSDLFELGYEAVGEIDSRLEKYIDWKVPFEEGVIYYLNEGRVRGVLLWNVWEQVATARKLIAEPGPFSPDILKGRI